ncbi:alanine racemase [Bradyrhizobium prioriisuperbiae]|uniref:alanine racemase n=1 Tax=Bradyrhizobium prioriisuperbiae TaxID=2854389 RepID=UPI0028EE1D1B|nr:alanine racemase [Bradyrhizobium prioritasuperba]
MSADSYFAGLSAALHAAEIHQPCLVLDLDRLNANIARIKSRLAPGLQVRIVDKSLPCLPLLAHIRKALATDLVMTFHLPVSAAVATEFPSADLLFGKPMPVGAARHALTKGALADPAGPGSRIVWLIDTDERLAAYHALAEELRIDLRFCFEVDVGLHRGGYRNPDALLLALKAQEKYPRLHCQGVMAYEAHIGHVPGLFGGPKAALGKARSLIRQFVACLAPHQRTILNIGGSSTALLYDSGIGANELSMGSAFVLPTDFDVPSLSGLKPAVHIATPILKVVDPQVPGFDDRSWILQKLGKFPRRGCFLYGGRWMAKPVHPPGLTPSQQFWHSTNQQFAGLPDDADVKPDDFAFLRPTQSEFVLQLFGPITVYSGERIVDTWPVLPPS